MKLALIGYGKMGKAIEEIALKRSHQIVLKAGRNWLPDEIDGCDVAIEFSQPEAAVRNIEICLDKKVPVVIGTTGWYSEYERLAGICRNSGGAMLAASNFSIGVNIFFKLNQYLAGLMNHQPEYEVTLNETHHVHKLDAPSGTAITLANDLVQMIDRKNRWISLEGYTNVAAEPFDLKVVSHRLDEVPGTHTITYASEIDEIEITHQAHSRKGFALGAVVAAEWINGKKGVFNMNDVLSL